MRRGATLYRRWARVIVIVVVARVTHCDVGARGWNRSLSPPVWPARMANSSSELVWQCIKGNNAFLRKGSKGRADAIFSAEPGNLYNKHSYKFSGAARSSRLARRGAGLRRLARSCAAPQPLSGEARFALPQRARAVRRHLHRPCRSAPSPLARQAAAEG